MLVQQLFAKSQVRNSLLHFQLETSYPDGSFSWFFSLPPFLQAQARKFLKIRHDPFLRSVYLVTNIDNHPTIPQVILIDTALL
jgi:hypothetical protein